MKRSIILLIIPLVITSFTHLWNVTNYPAPDIDEGTYLGRAVYFLDTSNPTETDSYTHPYFGQIFLAGILYLVGYQNLLTPGTNPNNELLFLVPRILMALLAILDTFLIFKIVEFRYNRKAAFIASMLFAVMPITLITRLILLDTLQLPFILSSILFAILSGKVNGSNSWKNLLLVMTSGIFLGLAIFTKIPGFTMIPLISYLVYIQNKKSPRLVALWLIPVLLIPAIWPLHAISLGQFTEWLIGVNWQMHRESSPLYIALQDFFSVDSILLISGICGLIYAAIRRDIFIILFAFPFLIFAFVINFVSMVHLLGLAVIISISIAKLSVDVISFLKKKNRFLHLSSIGAIAVVLIFGLISTVSQMVVDENSQYFKAVDFVNQHLETDGNSKSNIRVNNGISVVSNPFFFWVQKYKFNNENNYFWDNKRFGTEKIMFIIDNMFKGVIQENEYQYGSEFGNLFSAFDTHHIASFKDNSNDSSTGIDVLETDLQRYNKSKINVENILDKDHEWSGTKFVQLRQGGRIMNMTVDTTNANMSENVNFAYLNKTIDLLKPYGYLQVSYYIPATTDATFTMEINDAENNNKLWSEELMELKGASKSEFFILPETLFGKRINIDIKADTYSQHTDSLLLKNFSIYH